jgi:phosphomannomutase
MIPWLLVIELLSIRNQPLSYMVNIRIQACPSPGEINFRLKDPEKAIESVRVHFEHDALIIDETDGISMEFPNWRFNLRSSNTESILRLKLETSSNYKLMRDKMAEISALL